MYKTLRILFCILACLCAVVTVFIFVYFGVWGVVPLVGGVIFAALMFMFKNKQEREELKANPPPPTGDFITGRVSDDSQTDKE